ncbi:hypothetical protein GRX03_15705 [Halovenus sp. WSH3]|uniref:DUF4350 domain-containing protein n=1 Tax=Halovenus carboxidivorans TaxID=2692199 RepID=A0A6B0TBN2_9EURY|nr:hypothetical protein [Halovenus carboxidivorans]MXR53043.1 hypothetical protein [Halovenus carboxidivorans]
MNRWATLLGVFVGVFVLTVGLVAVGGFVLGDSQPNQADVQTDQWQLDNVAPDGASEGGEITMDSEESNKTVLVHLPSTATASGTGIQIPLQGTDSAITTGSAAGQERSVGALASTLVANGHEVEFYTQSTQTGSSFGQQSTLATELSDVDAFVTVAPASLSSTDLADVRTFAEEGGRVFVGADPGQVQGTIEVGSPAGIYQETGYVYNVAENDQNFLSVFAEPSGESPITDGIERVVFRGAAPVNQAGETPVFTTEGQLTTSQQNGTFGVGAVDGNMTALGDTSFLRPENAYRADNNVLIGNLADFLVTGNVSENPFQESAGVGQPGGGTPPGGGLRPPTNGTSGIGDLDSGAAESTSD